MNSQSNQPYPGQQQPGQPGYAPINSRPFSATQGQNSNSFTHPAHREVIQGSIAQNQAQSPYPSIGTSHQSSQLVNMANMGPPRGSGPQSNGSQPSTSAPVPAPEVVNKSENGKTYKLEVAQEPVRARMCGFGDKDRRPITPPPCVRLVIIDDKTGQECETTEFDTNFFILTVDLWDETGLKEVNLVRHSATSPSISAATSSSYPPPTNPVYPYSANTAATMNAHTQQAHAAQGMQVHVGLTAPGYGPQGYGAHHAAPYMSQPPPQSPAAQQSPGAMQQYGHDPSRSSAQETQSYYVSPQGQPTGATAYPNYGQQAMGGYGGAQPMTNLMPPAHTTPMDPRSAPSGMFTRNLIGSLAVNANPLTDTHGKLGIWFILQDLSVRTEGTFRLKMQFCNVEDPVHKGTLNIGVAPILATCFSNPFHVFSAKKFPGVIESTPLSKCFAMQGVKIPIRKDGPTGKAAEVDDDADGGN